MGKSCFLFGAFFFCSFCAAAQAGVETGLERLTKTVGGRVGMYARVLETGESMAYHGNEFFPMQSVYKFPIAMVVLDRVDKGRLSPDQLVRVDPSEYIPGNGHSPLRDQYPNGAKVTVKQLLRYCVAESDGTASDVLLRLVGGAGEAQQYIRHLGIQNMDIATTEMVQVADDTIQYRNRSTPEAMSRLFGIFFRGKALSPESEALLMGYLSPSSPWFNRRIKGLLPPGTPVIHKTGTSGTTTDGLTRATNDAGIITLPDGRHLALSVFIADSRASQEARESAIARIAKRVFDHFAGKE